jgi:tetratricopeptide (TPR) repeat protein
MPQPNTTFLESLASRYNLADSLDWQPLIRHFELGQGFAFIVLLVPNDDWAEVCREALNAFLQARGEHVMQIPIAAPADLQDLAGTLLYLRAESGTGAIWVARAVPEALPDYQLWFQAWRRGVAWLNQYRNPLRRQFEIPVIFVGAPWLQEVLRDNAPDLWSVRTLVARVKPEASSEAISEIRVPSPDHAGPSRGPDPEFALGEANRLRGKQGAELALARLLYRAGMGFAARYQWSDAEQAFSEALEIRQRATAQPEDVADAGYQLGIALTWLSKYDLATVMLSRARSAYESAGNLAGLARSLWALGNVGLRSSDLNSASARYEEALTLFRSLGDVLGEADCVAGLGNSALRTGDDEAARVRYEQALPLFRSIHNARGEAICIFGLGEIAFQRADLQTALARYQEALPLYRKFRHVSGEADCIARLGDIALNRRDIKAAHARFEEAQALYSRIGNLWGEANCLAGFGDIAAEQADSVSAKGYYRDAAKLYEHVSEHYGVGRVYRLLAQISDGQERDQYLAAARAAYERAGRQDLIALLDREFTPPTPPAASPK